MYIYVDGCKLMLVFGCVPVSACFFLLVTACVRVYEIVLKLVGTVIDKRKFLSVHMSMIVCK